jgi:thioredoxin 1
MKGLISCFLALGSTLFAATRADNLKIIIQRTYLQPHCEPLFHMMAEEAIEGSGKKIAIEELIEQFHESFKNEKTLQNFFKPYETLFSDTEVDELRKILDNPIWVKYYSEGGNLMGAQLQNMKDLFKELAVNFVVEEAKEREQIAAADVLQVTQDTFSEISKSKLPVIIDVTASWCQACQMLAPIVNDLSEKYKGKILFAKIDIDSQKALADQYGVTALPTLLFLQPGKKTPVMKNVGYLSKKDFEAKITEFLK